MMIQMAGKHREMEKHWGAIEHEWLGIIKKDTGNS